MSSVPSLDKSGAEFDQYEKQQAELRALGLRPVIQPKLAPSRYVDMQTAIIDDVVQGVVNIQPKAARSQHVEPKFHLNN